MVEGSQCDAFLSVIGCISGVKVMSIANADVDFCSKMASLTAVMQRNRSRSLLSPRKGTGMMTHGSFGPLHSSILLFLSVASMLHCALADGKTLVLLDNLNIKDTHSIFFRSLAGQYEIRAFSSINTSFFTVTHLLYCRLVSGKDLGLWELSLT